MDVRPHGRLLTRLLTWLSMGMASVGLAAEPTEAERFDAWVVQCQSTERESTGETVRVCAMRQSLSRQTESGERVPFLSVLIGLENDYSGILQGSAVITTPLTVRLQRGAMLKIESLEIPAQYITCTPSGCLARASFDPNAMRALLTYDEAAVGFASVKGRVISAPLSTEGFDMAWRRAETLIQ